MDIDMTARKILYLLQDEDRTDLTHTEIAERVGVSSSTVSNRLSELRAVGVLVNYEPIINYERAGVPHHLLVVCTAPISERKQLAEQAIDLHRVVCVRELLTGKENIHVELVTEETSSLETAVEALDQLGLEIENSKILRREHRQPFNDFGDETGEA